MDYERQFNPYNYFTPETLIHTPTPLKTLDQNVLRQNTGKIRAKIPYEKPKISPYQNDVENFSAGKFSGQDEFVMTVKRQRIRLGFTQADVGISLGAMYNKHFSQTTVCR